MSNKISAFTADFANWDSQAVGQASDALIDKVDESGREFRAEAWQMSLAQADKDMDVSIPFDYHGAFERWACLVAIWKELRRGLG